MNIEKNAVLILLGKLDKFVENNSQDVSKGHLLIYHSLEVAAVTLKLWNMTVPPKIKLKFLKSFDNIADFPKFIAFFASLHDIGKITPMFQELFFKKNEAYRTNLKNQNLLTTNINVLKRVHHSILSYSCLGDPLLFDLFGNREIIKNHFQTRGLTFGNWLGKVLAAHHGVFHNSIVLNQRLNTEKGNSAWAQLRSCFSSILFQIICKDDFDSLLNVVIRFENLIIDEISENPIDKSPSFSPIPLAVWLAGLICVADWIASNPEFFPYHQEHKNEEELLSYWDEAQVRAENVIRDLSWELPPLKKDSWTFANLFHFENTRPLQNLCLEIHQDQPGCVIIEAPMGEGKTECAMFLAAKNEEATNGCRGIYFALPTQATSNQMFKRVKEFEIGRAHV